MGHGEIKPVKAWKPQHYYLAFIMLGVHDTRGEN